MNLIKSHEFVIAFKGMPKDSFTQYVFTDKELYECFENYLDDFHLLKVETNLLMETLKLNSISDIFEFKNVFLFDLIRNNITFKSEIVEQLKKDDVLGCDMFKSTTDIGKEILQWFEDAEIYLRVELLMKENPLLTYIFVNVVDWNKLFLD